ncbi:MAG: lipid-transfer protein [Acidimicrobiia bacterium]|nr:lipid-transfer protein [Acidimicrobiia bacterium]
MSTNPGRAVIAGIGHTEFSQDSGRSTLRLASEASIAALRDAGFASNEIDGSVTFSMDTNDELALIRSLGIPLLRFSARTRGGGGGANATVQLAAAAVESGQAEAVLIYRAFNERSQHRFGQPVRPSPDPAWNWAVPFGLDTPAKIYSLTFQRYMHDFGLTNEDFGRYTVVARDWAATNPNAQFFERPITLADHQASRWIVEPILRKLDCCLESDGGVALVVTSAERAEAHGADWVDILANGAMHLRDGHEMFNYFHDDLSWFDEGASLGADLYARAGLTPDDIDVAMIYENFSPIVFQQLEAFGFCGRGEARDFIADGHIGRGGSLPVNTNGGLLGEGYIHGMNNIVEGVRQLRGTAANQIDGARHVLVTAGRSGTILGARNR